MNENIFIWNKEKGCAEISSEIAFVFQSQHGIPVEMFEEMVNEKFPPLSTQKAYAVTKAYDKAFGTDWASKLPNVLC